MLAYYVLLILAMVFAYIAGCGVGTAVAEKREQDEWGATVIVLIVLALLCATPVALQLH